MIRPSSHRGYHEYLAMPLNQAHAPNPAMTSWFHAGRQWRGVGDARR